MVILQKLGLRTFHLILEVKTIFHKKVPLTSIICYFFVQKRSKTQIKIKIKSRYPHIFIDFKKDRAQK